jgi:5-methylcytosine-specific restriction protein A
LPKLKSLEESKKEALTEVKISPVGEGGSDKTAEVIKLADETEDDSDARYISDEELAKRIRKSDKVPKTKQITDYIRNEYISEFAKRKAKGFCQLCEKFAPFNDTEGNPYLESHHVIWLSRGGEDSVENVIALCPNCHAKIHELDIESDVERLKRKAMENSRV